VFGSTNASNNNNNSGMLSNNPGPFGQGSNQSNSKGINTGGKPGGFGGQSGFGQQQSGFGGGGSSNNNNNNNNNTNNKPQPFGNNSGSNSSFLDLPLYCLKS
jgi:hypothetical protein